MRRIIFTIATVALLIPLTVQAMNIDSVYRYAWSENAGWIDFGTSEGNVNVSATAMSGYAWSENAGWISLNCSNTSTCGTVSYGATISDYSATTKNVSGYAWGENIGWISFSCANTSSCGTVSYGVQVDSGTGVFTGFAWSENIGWINFNCANTSVCGISDFKVKTSIVLATPSSPPGAVAVPPRVPVPPVASLSPSVVPTATASASAGGGSVAVPGQGGTRPRIPPPERTGTPLPSPSSGFQPPTAPPPGEVPTSSPPAASENASPSEIVDRITSSFDSFVSSLALPSPTLCGGSLGIMACATTAIPTISLIAALFAALLQNELLAGIFSMLEFLGLRRKPKVWGVVYDSRTKHPIALAKLELFDAANRLLETRYADRDGRYGFLMSPASLHEQELRVQLRATKPGYAFPSVSGIVGTDYIVYDNLYHGGEIVMKGDALLNYNIPMDPVAGHHMSLMEFGQGLVNPLGERLLTLGFYLGLVTVPLTWWFNPSTKNLVIAIVFIVANAIRSLVLHRPHGITTDVMTGKRMPFALVILNDLQGARQGFAVSDEHGRFILSGEQNKDYEILAYTPANVVPQRSIRMRVRGIRRMTTRAWITNNLHV